MGFTLEVDPLSHWGFPDAPDRVRRGGHRGRSPGAGASRARARDLARRARRRSALSRSGSRCPRTFSLGSRSVSAAGALVRLALGSPLGAPPMDSRARGARAHLGVDVSDLRIASASKCGATEYFGHGEDGGPLKVRVLGRDAQDTQRVARRWRLLAYRDPPRSAPIGRLEQVEHEALTTLMAATGGRARARGGHRRPRPRRRRVAGHPPARSRRRWSSRAPTQVSDELLEELCRQVGTVA